MCASFSIASRVRAERERASEARRAPSRRNPPAPKERAKLCGAPAEGSLPTVSAPTPPSSRQHHGNPVEGELQPAIGDPQEPPRPVPEAPLGLPRPGTSQDLNLANSTHGGGVPDPSAPPEPRPRSATAEVESNDTAAAFNGPAPSSSRTLKLRPPVGIKKERAATGNSFRFRFPDPGHFPRAPAPVRKSHVQFGDPSTIGLRFSDSRDLSFAEAEKETAQGAQHLSCAVAPSRRESSDCRSG